MEASFRETLRHITTELLTKLGYAATVKTSEAALPGERVGYHIDIELTEGQNLLIGQHGANVSALLHVIRLLARDHQPVNASISVDVNRYFQEKKVYLEREAALASREVEETGLPVMLRPMVAYERKLIHTFFAEHPTITTESVGHKEERKILLRRRGEATNRDGEDQLGTSLI